MLTLVDKRNTKRMAGMLMHDNAFGLYLKKMRLNSGYTQTEVKNYLKLSSSGVVSHWEQEKSYMSNSNAWKLAKLYRVDPEILLFRLFLAKNLEPTFRKWSQQYKGCNSVLSFIQECDRRKNVKDLIEMESSA